MLTQEQYEFYLQEGYVTVPDLFSTSQLSAVLEAAEQNAYGGKSFAEFKTELNANPDLENELRLPGAGLGFAGPRAEFCDIPTGVEIVDQVLEHDPFLDALEQLLDTPDIHYHHGYVYVRNGRIDRKAPTKPEIEFHLDWAKPFIPPHPDWQRYGHIQAWVFLDDIDEDCAPVRLVPGVHDKMGDILRVIEDDGLGFGDIRKVPHSYRFADIRKILHAQEPVSITGKAGSVLFYSGHTPHAAQPFADKDKQRAVIFFSIGRRDTMAWTSTGKREGEAIRRLKPFLGKTTSRVRSLFGWPKPGDAMYTPTSVELIKNAYPEMDVSDYL